MAFMTLNQIDVSYDKKKQILKGLDLKVEKGELVSLLGPSGCGKSTTLRVVAGFIDPQGGTFTLDGEDMTRVAVHKRNFGLVFQSYALFPHLSVYDNVAFGLRTRKMDKETIDKKVKDILEVCGLTELAQRFPKQMSGGQRQRVALARATLCLCPPDICFGNLCASSVSPQTSRISFTFLSMVSLSIFLVRSPKATLSYTLRWGNRA